MARLITRHSRIALLHLLLGICIVAGTGCSRIADPPFSVTVKGGTSHAWDQETGRAEIKLEQKDDRQIRTLTFGNKEKRTAVVIVISGPDIPAPGTYDIGREEYAYSVVKKSVRKACASFLDAHTDVAIYRSMEGTITLVNTGDAGYSGSFEFLAEGGTLEAKPSEVTVSGTFANVR